MILVVLRHKKVIFENLGTSLLKIVFLGFFKRVN